MLANAACSGCFELIVLGKNGATVSGEPYVPGTPPVSVSYLSPRRDLALGRCITCMRHQLP